MKRTRAMALVLLTACGTPSDPDAGGAARNMTPTSVTTSAGQGGKLDGLTFRLELDRTGLQPGDQTGATLLVQNNTDEAIIDPGCYVGAGKFGLVPADDPGATLEYEIVVDCSGPNTFDPGFEDAYSSYDFRAATIYGDPLPPGEYLASLRLRGFSERISAPVTVTD
jgi:hypothetical protein